MWGKKAKMNALQIKTIKGHENHAKWKVAIRALLDLEDLWDS